MRRHPFRAGKTENIPRPSFRWFGELLVYVQKSRFPSDHFKDQKDHLFYYDCSNSPNRFFKRLFFFLKKEGVMKKTLLIFGLFLLFATEAKALSCPSGQYFVANASCGEIPDELGDRCVSCPDGCTSCSPIRFWTTCQAWDATNHQTIYSYTYDTTATCNACESGYELKSYSMSGYDGTTSTPFTGYDCKRKASSSPSCPANCSSCSSSSTCTACKSGYTLKNGQCVKPCPANCSKCDSSGSCTQCNGGYKLKNGACEAGSVISCPDDMRLSADGCCCIAG